MTLSLNQVTPPGLLKTPSRLQKLVESGHTAQGFWWMTGIEGSTIPHIQADEFEWIQHYQFWNEDLTMIRRDLEANWLRLVFPWYKVNPARGKYNWDWMDRVIDRAAKLGFQIALDPIHFGTPLWMADGFGEPDFPEYAGEYFSQVARRYGKIEQIQAFVPHNEPSITALFGGLFGDWPPYKHSQAGYNHLIAEIAKGIVLAQQAVRAEVSDPVFLHIDAVDQAATLEDKPSEQLLEEISLINERRFLCYDLLSGRVNSSHRLTNWLLQNGLNENQLLWLEANGSDPDIVGIDFYTHSEAWVSQTPDGNFSQDRQSHALPTVQLYEKGYSSSRINAEAPRPGGLHAILKAYYERYQRPMVVTETDFCGTVAERHAWLDYTLEEIKRSREENLPVIGYTWWGATDHLNWGMALKERNNIHPVGLWSLVPQFDGTMARHKTSLVDTFRGYTESPQAIIGEISAR